MLMPKKTKYRKQQKGRVTGVATRGVDVSFGQFGLKADGTDRISSRQIEAARSRFWFTQHCNVGICRDLQTSDTRRENNECKQE